MSEPPSHPPPDDDLVISRAPRWVRVSGIVGAVVLVLLVAVLLFGGGAEHGPRRHTGGDSPPGSDVSELDDNGGHVPPEGGHG